jgi:hypothetical protein
MRATEQKEFSASDRNAFDSVVWPKARPSRSTKMP